MRTIEEIQADLRALAQELEDLKKKDALAEEIDLNQISSIAARSPVRRHPLAASADAHTKKNYLIPLLAVSQYAGESLEESLLYAHRVAYGMRYLSEGQTLRQEYLASITLSFAQLDECAHLFQDTPARLMLVLEMLVMAGSFGKGKKKALEYIAKMCMLLKLRKEEVTFLGELAAVILTKDLSRYRCKIQNTYALFDGYLEDIEFPRKLVFPKVDRKVGVQEGEYTHNFYFQKAYIKFNQRKSEWLCQCTYTYARCSWWLADYLPRYKEREREVTQKVEPYTYLLRSNLSSSIDRNTIKDMDYAQWVQEGEQLLKKETDKLLSKPIGVQTHPLDSVTLAREWFEREEKKIH